MKNLYYINLSYATFGIVEENNIIIETAPIGKWMLNKNIDFIKTWVKNKNGEIIKL
jgi:hypothetical protein